MPETIPTLPDTFFENIDQYSFGEIGFAVAKQFIQNEIPEGDLKSIIDNFPDFDAPLVRLEEGLYVLELFHGPTLAFKDFGARFMAGILSHFVAQENKELNILVATSGDTGSAVAGGFYKVPGINVFILYPSGKVSEIQEKQLTTWGENITAIEVQGTFDDCQRMVKQAFTDEQIKAKLQLTSANSINIARLIPQSFYYFHAYAQLLYEGKTATGGGRGWDELVFSVPSGNFGNLTAGLFAQRMGLPVSKFIASTNINDVVPEYLQSHVFSPRASQQTISNAMDVGNPSNFARMKELMPTAEAMQEKISGFAFSDDETREVMRKVYNKYKYVIDPHGAVGYLGLMDYKKNQNVNGIFLETAHPAKFVDVVEPVLQQKIEIPDHLQQFIKKKKNSIPIANSFVELKNFLLR